jgi:hypothetical protein
VYVKLPFVFYFFLLYNSMYNYVGVLWATFDFNSYHFIPLKKKKGHSTWLTQRL